MPLTPTQLVAGTPTGRFILHGIRNSFYVCLVYGPVCYQCFQMQHYHDTSPYAQSDWANRWLEV